MARLKETYQSEIVEAMIKKFGYKNIMEVPKLDKIVINMGVGEAKENAKVLDSAVRDLEIISGQKAVLTKAKKSIANFKLREGMPIGCKVTLRGETSGVLILTLLTAEETMPLVSRNSLFSLKLSTIKLTRSEVWTSFSLLPLRPMKKPVNF